MPANVQWDSGPTVPGDRCAAFTIHVYVQYLRMAAFSQRAAVRADLSQLHIRKRNYRVCPCEIVASETAQILFHMQDLYIKSKF